MSTAQSVRYKAKGLKILEAAPIEWPELVKALPSSEMLELSRWLDSVSEGAARLSAYVEARGGSGCGDSGHDRAVKAQNRRAAKVRRALGYTFPKLDFTF